MQPSPRPRTTCSSRHSRRSVPIRSTSVYQSELAAIPNGPAETRGVAIGQQAAAAMLATRADEDIFAAINAPYTPGTKPGDYQATPPVGMVVGAGWSGLRTFAVQSSKQFRAPRPYASLRSLDYAMDVNEIELLGKAVGSGRTTDQTAIAFYWYENSSFAWNRIARKVAGGLSLLGHARLYAALNAAISDAYMTSLESKFSLQLLAAHYGNPCGQHRRESVDDSGCHLGTSIRNSAGARLSIRALGSGWRGGGGH